MKSLLGNFSTTRSFGGKPIHRQLWEALRLRLRKLPLGVSEYFEYGVWHSTVTSAMSSEFIGWRGSEDLDRRLNNQQSRVLANDKLVNYVMLAAAGLPMPEPLATFTPEGRRIGGEVALRSQEDVLAYVRGDIYPCYAKPISAGYGRGVMGLAAFRDGRFTLLDGTTIDVDTFLKPFRNPKFHGMLFQKPLTAHPDVAALTGSHAISCVRCICFVTSKGPVIHTAFWKIISGSNMLDNFSHGDYGNCLGAVEVASGRIERAISRLGPGGEITTHPTTGKSLTGFVLPDWQRAVELVKTASAHFPGLHLQNWDVALCPQGPVLLELNTESELAVPQAISRRGLMDDSLRAILADMKV